MSNVLLENAFALAKSGLYVFPVHDFSQGFCSCRNADCARIAKHPRTAHGLKDATKDPATIAAWWELWPEANIGINCGMSKMTVIDVDCKKGALGFATIKPIAEAFPDVFSIAPTSRTPSGGLHIWGMGEVQGGPGVIGPGIDVQSTGRYVIAPPSRGQSGSYEWTRGGGMPPWPQELKAMMDGRHSKSNEPGSFTLGDAANGPDREEGARESIPSGEHRDALLKHAWHLRRVLGYSAQKTFEKIKIMANDPNDLEGLDPTRPFANSDLWKMVTSELPNVATEETISTESIRLSEIKLHDEPNLTWLIPHYVPLAELLLLYGEGAVGKSTLMAWVAADITNRERRFGVVGSEDARNVFAARALINGAKPNLIYLPRHDVCKLKLDDKGYKWIENFITENELSVLYFDSIRSHFPTINTDAATAARDALMPLQEIAKRLLCAIIGTFHLNKAGEYSGSTEMRNVPRILFKAKSKEQKDEEGKEETILHVEITKTNFEMPKTKLEFVQTVQPYINDDGTPMMQTFVEIGGGLRHEPRNISTWKFRKEVPIGKTTLAEAAGGEAFSEPHPHALQIALALKQNPNASASSLHKNYGGNKQKFFAEVKRQRIVQNLPPQGVEVD